MQDNHWGVFVPYNSDLYSALEEAKQAVFEAGDYQGSELKPAHKEEACMNAGGQGTSSVLDMSSFGDFPDYATVSPLTEDQLVTFFGTAMPDREMLINNPYFFHSRIAGQGMYIICYEGGEPSEVFFGGVF